MPTMLLRTFSRTEVPIALVAFVFLVVVLDHKAIGASHFGLEISH